ncbi:MAG TPA: undecaprenyl-diphosphate phosphatase [Chitinophagaceae bacterium]|nr:undecaprenyl-diphosphate phosphatase [Chitinophagaceae bacterium]
MNTIQAILIAIIEGLTEFLPISSTAHMVITSAFMKIEGDAFTKYFEICIQFGAILSVVVLYFKKFINFKNPAFYLKLIIAIIPSLILGFLLNDFIDANLENPLFIAIIMMLGGVILLFVDKWFNHPIITDENDIDHKLALKIGLFQCLSIIFPGLSRSASTIIGGMSQKLSREAAAEFSFFLAVPTMFAATSYKTLKYVKEFGGFSMDQLTTLLIGNVVAFVVALLAIKFFINFLKQKGFKLFGYYRIILGAIVLICIATGIIDK